MHFRRDKTRPLTAAEGDENIDELLAKIEEARVAAERFRLSAAGFDGPDLVLATQEGDSFTIHVPWPVQRYVGAWQPLTFYSTLAEFKVDGKGIYIVVVAHTSAAIFDENATDIDLNPLYQQLFPLASARYIIGASWPGKMTAPNQNIFFDGFTRAVTIPANFGAYDGDISTAGGSVTPTGSVTIDVAKAPASNPTSFSTVGSISFSAGSVVPSFATSGGVPILFAQGDAIRIRGPASPDATFADFRSSLVAFATPIS